MREDAFAEFLDHLKHKIFPRLIAMLVQIMEVSWVVFWIYSGRLGGLWEAIERFLGRRGSLLGRLGAILGASLVLFCRRKAGTEQTLKNLQTPMRNKWLAPRMVFLEAFWIYADRSRALLGPSRVVLGYLVFVPRRTSGNRVGYHLGCFGSILGRLGALLEVHWAIIGSPWGRLKGL